MFNQLLANGLIAGSVYALVASGFSLIYATCRFVHFAHGATVVVSSYILYLLLSVLGLNFGLAIILTLFWAALFGWLINKIIYQPLRKRKASGVILLVASIGLLILIESSLLLVFGADVKTIKYLKITRGWEILGAIITPWQIVTIITSLVLLILLFFFMKKTRLGKAMRAVSDNPEVAEIVGISAERIYAWAFVIGSAIAGVAGILIGLEQNLEPAQGTDLMIKGFTGAIVGGIGSVPGAVLGSFFLGLVENFSIWWLPSEYKSAIAFVILFLFLLLRPEGILGIRENRVK